MKTCTARVAICVVIAAAAGRLCEPARAQVARVGARYSFRVRYLPGQHIRYRMTVTTTMPLAAERGTDRDMPKGPITMTAIVAHRVTKVRSGVASLQIASSSLTMGGFEGLAGDHPGTVRPPFPTILMTVDAHGRATADGPGVPGLAAGMGELAMILPGGPLGRGDSFTVTKPVTLVRGPTTVRATVTFRGIATVGRRRVARFGLVTQSEGGSSIHGSGTLLLSAADGTLVRLAIVHRYSMVVGEVRGQATQRLVYQRQ